MTKLVVATTNPGKVREINDILSRHTAGGAELPVEFVSLEQFPGLVEPEETGATFAENARLKALFYADATGLPSVADDSGLEIAALDNAPGVHSARWHGTDYAVKFRKIYELLTERGVQTSPARFVCHLALADRGRHHLRDDRNRQRRDRARTAWDERLRLRPHLLLPSVRVHAGRARPRAEGHRQPSRQGVQCVARVSLEMLNASNPSLRPPVQRTRGTQS